MKGIIPKPAVPVSVEDMNRAPSGELSMAITEADLKAAEAEMKAYMAAVPLVAAVRYDHRVSRIVISLGTGLELAFPPRLEQGLEHAKPGDLDIIEITPTGLGLHFPKLEADLYIPALLEGLLGSKKWMASAMARAGGKARSEAKVAAARANGKLGGRPRKAAISRE